MRNEKKDLNIYLFDIWIYNNNNEYLILLK